MVLQTSPSVLFFYSSKPSILSAKDVPKECLSSEGILLSLKPEEFALLDSPVDAIYHYLDNDLNE